MAPALPKINLDAIIKLPLSKKIGILGAANAVIAGLIGYLLIYPQVEDGLKLRKDLHEVNEKLVNSRQIAGDIPRYLQEKQDMIDRLKKAEDQLPKEKEIPDLIDSISAAGLKSGLNILLFRPGREVPKGFYAEIPVSMQVEGRYESLYEFSAKVGAMKRIVNLGSMDISTSAIKNRAPVIKANFNATTFRFLQTAPSAGKDKKEDKAAKKE